MKLGKIRNITNSRSAWKPDNEKLAWTAWKTLSRMNGQTDGWMDAWTNDGRVGDGWMMDGWSR